jgi:hypothetical protein
MVRDGSDTQSYAAIVVQADRTVTLNAQLKAVGDHLGRGAGNPAAQLD